MNANVTLNNEKNGIEIRFEGKPAAEIIESLKANGFRWSNKQKMWYAKQNDKTIAFANSIGEGVISSTETNKTEKHGTYDLWEMTRTEGIADNYSLYKILDVKEIAAIIRKHIKPRFPMCKFSVTSDHNSIDIDLLASPFAKDSDEVKAILHYVHAFAESYNYDNSDLMTDYFDVNFYLSSEYSMVSYRYEQTKMTEIIQAMATAFAEKKAEFEAAEKIRKQEEYEAYLTQMEAERKVAEVKEKLRKIDHQAVENGVKVVNLDDGYFLSDLLSPNVNKCPVIDEIESQIEDGSCSMVLCHVTREVHMTTEIYNLFKNMLLDDFSFLAGMGGSRTDDNRISAMIDYEHMTKEERETVKWYNINCVAIFCDGNLMMVCDPQGHDYARYAFLPSESTKNETEHITEQVITSEQLDEYRAIAESLEDRSGDIIIKNGWIDTWNEQNFNEYRKAIIKAIKDNSIPFNVNVVRAISDEGAFKIAMYRILETPVEIRDQFEEAGFAEGEKITIIRFDDCLGGMRCGNATFQRYEHSDWGGKSGVKVIVTVPHKRGEYYQILNSECLVVRGWVELPRSLFWEDVPSATGLRCEKTRFLSFDRKQFDVTIDYLRSIGADIAVNTYKPIFD